MVFSSVFTWTCMSRISTVNTIATAVLCLPYSTAQYLTVPFRFQALSHDFSAVYRIFFTNSNDGLYLYLRQISALFAQYAAVRIAYLRLNIFFNENER